MEIRSLYRSGSLSTIARELARHKLDVGGVRTVKWGTKGPVRAGDFISFMAKETKIINWEQYVLYATE
jgi:hypothetical protein